MWHQNYNLYKAPKISRTPLNTIKYLSLFLHFNSLSLSLTQLIPSPLNMSIITITSPKYCATKQVLRIGRKYKKFFFPFSTVFTTILLFILLIYLILKPTNPQYSIQQLDIYNLNFSRLFLNFYFFY